MDDERFLELQESLQRCSRTNAYLDTFYEIFFQQAPHLQEHFRQVDMEAQKQKLAASLPKMLALPSFDPGSQEVKAARLEHQARHAGGRSQNYTLWINSICQTFSRHDPDFNPSLRTILQERLEAAVELLQPGEEASAVG